MCYRFCWQVKKLLPERRITMNRVREASTMSVPTMRQMLGLKKTASY